MAFPIQQAVIDFHLKFGHPVRYIPQTISKEEADQAFSFIDEELQELEAAMEFEGCGYRRDCCTPRPADLVEIADALGDIVFTAYGMAVRHGIDLDLVLKEICESNMTKTPNGMGKIKKGDDYVAPNIARALSM